MLPLQREVVHAAFDKGHVDGVVFCFLASDRKHGRRRVYPGDGVTLTCEFDGYPARATADFQHRPVGPPGERSPEASVLAEVAVDGVIVGGVDGVWVGGHWAGC